MSTLLSSTVPITRGASDVTCQELIGVVPKACAWVTFQNCTSYAVLLDGSDECDFVDDTQQLHSEPKDCHG